MTQRTALLAALFLAVFGWGISPADAQEIEATVSINVDQIPSADQQELSGFADEMKRYIDEMKWTGEEWAGEKVTMNMNVVVTGGGGGYYTAKFLVGSQRKVAGSGNLTPMMKVLDEYWEFRYTRNQPFQHDPTSYDHLSGPIDFYAYVALGLELDSRTLYGGNTMYERASELAQRAQLRSDSKGWTTQAVTGSYSRVGFVRELTNARFAPLRAYIFNYHKNGLDLLAGNRAAALDSVNNHLTSLVFAIDKLVESSTIVRVLNDTKYREYAELFTGVRDPMVWRKLLFIDPIHQAIYEEAKNK